MFFQIIVCSTLVAFSCGAPQHHAISYVSTNVAGHGEEGGEDGGLGSHYVQHSAPITYIKHVPIIVKQEEKYEEKHNEEDHGHARYEFHYGVEDKHTGDIKSQKESRNGDVVKGEYSLKEADGTTRIVKYTSDKKNGFNAVVIRKGHAAHPQVEHKKIVVPVVQHHDDRQQLLYHY